MRYTALLLHNKKRTDRFDNPAFLRHCPQDAPPPPFRKPRYGGASAADKAAAAPGALASFAPALPLSWASAAGLSLASCAPLSDAAEPASGLLSAAALFAIAAHDAAPAASSSSTLQLLQPTAIREMPPGSGCAASAVGRRLQLGSSTDSAIRHSGFKVRPSMMPRAPSLNAATTWFPSAEKVAALICWRRKTEPSCGAHTASRLAPSTA